MNSKYIFIFVMTLVVGSSFILYLNSESDVEFLALLKQPHQLKNNYHFINIYNCCTNNYHFINIYNCCTTTTTSSTSTTVAPTTTTSSTSTTVAQSTGAIGDEESVQIVDNNEETPIL